MLRTWRRPPTLFSDFNTFQFAGVMGLVLLVLLLVFVSPLVNRPDPVKVFSADVPRVSHPVRMPAALREDSLQVGLTRDGKLYFMGDQVRASQLSERISERLKDKSVERKVYITADLRARWGTVKFVLDAVRAAGVVRVAFLASERNPVIRP